MADVLGGTSAESQTRVSSHIYFLYADSRTIAVVPVLDVKQSTLPNNAILEIGPKRLAGLSRDSGPIRVRYSQHKQISEPKHKNLIRAWHHDCKM